MNAPAAEGCPQGWNAEDKDEEEGQQAVAEQPLQGRHVLRDAGCHRNLDEVKVEHIELVEHPCQMRLPERCFGRITVSSALKAS